LAAQPGESVPQASGNIAAAKATYNFWDSPYFQPSDIRNAHTASTIERIKEHEVVLAIQDTTDLDFTSHPETTGLGYLDHRFLSGLKVHSTRSVKQLWGAPWNLKSTSMGTRAGKYWDCKKTSSTPNKRKRKSTLV
jgi:hypothetical protein